MECPATTVHPSNSTHSPQSLRTGQVWVSDFLLLVVICCVSLQRWLLINFLLLPLLDRNILEPNSLAGGIAECSFTKESTGNWLVPTADENWIGIRKQKSSCYVGRGFWDNLLHYLPATGIAVDMIIAESELLLVYEEVQCRLNCIILTSWKNEKNVINLCWPGACTGQSF